jgi:hypothetical protein
MREREMRQRVERFLQTRLRNMLMPATLGLGLALGGCGSSTPDSSDDGSAAKQDVGSPPGTGGGGNRDGAQVPDAGGVALYMAQLPPDAGPELPVATPDYMAQMPDSGTTVRYMAPQPPDAGRDFGGAVAKYLAPHPVSQS